MKFWDMCASGKKPQKTLFSVSHSFDCTLSVSRNDDDSFLKFLVDFIVQKHN